MSSEEEIKTDPEPETEAEVKPRPKTTTRPGHVHVYFGDNGTLAKLEKIRERYVANYGSKMTLSMLIKALVDIELAMNTESRLIKSVKEILE